MLTLATIGLVVAGAAFGPAMAATDAAAPPVLRMTRKKVTVPTDLSSHFNETSKAATSLEALRLRRLYNDDHFAVSRHLQDAVAMYGPFRQLAYFYADVFIGSPTPQRFSVITDTGSSLTAVPCEQCGAQCGTHMNPRFQPLNSQTVRPVGCVSGCTGCTGAGQCQYQQGYAEGSSISGIVYSDTAFLGDDTRNDPAARAAYTVTAFEFGCQLQEGGLFLTQKADGIMGIGQGHRSFIKTMWEQGKMRKNMFSVCMGLDGGAMTLGDVYQPLHKEPPQWASLTLTGFYVVNVESASMDNGAQSIPVNGFNSPGTTILDSGTTFTYVPSSTYSAITSYIRTACSQSGRCKGTPASVPGESYCYRLASPSDISSFPSLSWRLRGASVADGGTGQGITITMPPQHLFLNMGWDQGAYCLGVYSQGGSGAVLGANSMMGYDVILDLGQSRSDVAAQEPARSAPRVGFAPSDCNVDQPVTQPTPSPSPAAAVDPTKEPTTPSISATPSPIKPSAVDANAVDEATAQGRNAGIGLSVGLLVAFVAICCVCACCRRRGVVCKCCGMRFALQKSSAVTSAFGFDDENDTSALGGTIRGNNGNIDTSAVVVPVMEAGNKAVKATANAANKVARQVKAAVNNTANSAKKATAGGKVPGAASRSGAAASSSAAAAAAASAASGVFDDDDDDLNLDLEDLENDLGVGSKQSQHSVQGSNTNASASSASAAAPVTSGAASAKRQQRQEGSASNGTGSNASGGYRKHMAAQQQAAAANRISLDDDDDDDDDLGSGSAAGRRNVEL